MSPAWPRSNFADTAMGAKYVAPWWSGPLSPKNNRGQTNFMPSNLIAFDGAGEKIAENPALPENQRDLQYTVNGQFQPELKIKPGQTEIWAVANISDISYMTFRLTETATGNHPKFAIVGQDGNPYTQVGRPVYGDGTTLDIPPGSRYAIAVTMPKQGDLVLEFPPDPKATEITDPAVLYTNNGTKNPPAVLGTLTRGSEVRQLRRRILRVPDPDPDPRHAGHQRARADHAPSSRARTSTPTRPSWTRR